jgi:amidase
MHPTAGVRTTLGSPALADHVPDADARTVGLLRGAGADLVGKTSTAEFGATCFTHNPLTGTPTVTPFDVTRYSSGSSGGAATAVSAGLLPVAHGSDGAGSTRTPASTCHLVGVKPSRGLVSLAPAGGFMSLGIEGPLARTVEDAALLLDVMAHPWPGDVYGWEPPGTFTDALDHPATSLKIAVWTDTGLPGVEPHPQSVAAVRGTASLLRDLGHQVQEVALPAGYCPRVHDAILRLFVMRAGMAVPLLVPAERLHLVTPYTQHLMAQAPALTATDVLGIEEVLAQYATAFLAALADFDVALTPTTNGPPVPIGHYLADGAGGVGDRMLAWSCYTPWANLTGQPAVSLPAHVDDEGLPYGIQLIGRPRQDAVLLALAAQLESAHLWGPTHPPIWHE